MCLCMHACMYVYTHTHTHTHTHTGMVSLMAVQNSISPPLFFSLKNGDKAGICGGFFHLVCHEPLLVCNQPLNKLVCNETSEYISVFANL